MPWPETIITQFEIVDPDTTKESEFYGPYNTLLAELFHHSERYQISLPPKPIDRSPNLAFQFIIRRLKIPVFFLQIKTFRSLTLPSSRASADDQIRQRFRELAESGTISVPTLYGISAFGPQFRVYAFDSATRSTDPPAIARDLAIVNYIAPEAQWTYNILEPAGEAKFREVVDAVKRMATGL